MSEAIKKRDPQTDSINRTLKTLYPDVVKIASPEMTESATRLTAALNVAKKSLIAGNEFWPRGTFSDTDIVRFIRRMEEKYVAAPRDTVMGSPKELVAHIEDFINAGKLPSEQWENAVRQRRPSTEEPVINTGRPGGFDETKVEPSPEILREQARLREQCEAIQSMLHAKYRIDVDLGGKELEAKEILQDLEYLQKELDKLDDDPKLIEWIYKSKIYFVPKHPPGSAMYESILRLYSHGHPTEMHTQMPFFFTEFLRTDPMSMNVAAGMMARVRREYDGSLSGEQDMREASFWMTHLTRSFKRDYKMIVSAGDMDEDGLNKISTLEKFREIIEKLGKQDPNYLKILEGTVIDYNPQGVLGKFTIRYGFRSPPDHNPYSMEGRLNQILHNPATVKGILDELKRNYRPR